MTKHYIPGSIYHECLDPGCTEFTRETGILPAQWRRIGKGHQAVYELTDQEAEILYGHIRTFAEAISHGADPETMYVGRRILRWLDAHGR